jgi:hypothetical protein
MEKFKFSMFLKTKHIAKIIHALTDIKLPSVSSVLLFTNIKHCLTSIKKGFLNASSISK